MCSSCCWKSSNRHEEDTKTTWEQKLVFQQQTCGFYKNHACTDRTQAQQHSSIISTSQTTQSSSVNNRKYSDETKWRKDPRFVQKFRNGQAKEEDHGKRTYGGTRIVEAGFGVFRGSLRNLVGGYFVRQLETRVQLCSTPYILPPLPGYFGKRTKLLPLCCRRRQPPRFGETRKWKKK